MYFNYIFIIILIFLGNGFFSWDEEYLIASGLFLVIYFLYSLLNTSLFDSLNEQIDKIALNFMFFYTLNIIMLNILVNSFNRELELKNSISYVYLYLTSYTYDFSALNRDNLTSIYSSNVTYLLSSLMVYNFEVNNQIYLASSVNNFADLNKFMYNLENLISTS